MFRTGRLWCTVTCDCSLRIPRILSGKSFYSHGNGRRFFPPCGSSIGRTVRQGRFNPLKGNGMPVSLQVAAYEGNGNHLHPSIIKVGRTHANNGGLYMLGTILVILLILFLIGALPSWGYHNYGYGPSGGLGLVLVIVLIMVLLGRI